MRHIGRFDHKLLTVIIRPTHANYNNKNRDLSVAKSIILQFIMKTHITNRMTSTKIEDYKLNRCRLYGLKIAMKNDDDVSYHICVKSGDVYVSG